MLNDKEYNKKGAKMLGKYRVVTLCGSSRFKDEFYEVQKQLTLEGTIVLSLGFFSQKDLNIWDNFEGKDIKEIKEMLADMQRKKIDISDEIFIVNVDGYIGESTQSEIEYAISEGKKVRYLVNNQ